VTPVGMGSATELPRESSAPQGSQQNGEHSSAAILRLSIAYAWLHSLICNMYTRHVEACKNLQYDWWCSKELAEASGSRTHRRRREDVYRRF
jgi:hypothetical protein